MSFAGLKIVMRCAEFVELDELTHIPGNTRGIYVLLKRHVKLGKIKYDVVYIGMARGNKSGVKSRLRSHARKKKDMWTHFSVYEVWPNVTQAEVEELEGLFRAIYRKDTNANKFNAQRGFKRLKAVQHPLQTWQTLSLTSLLTK